ncbi:DUF883 family protein [Oleiharenicola lentus]|uniref:DUF883 family protein n=1 Tax=Oleiharenicola lentus TaxID=2508720 RepID=UPI003F679C6B
MESHFPNIGNAQSELARERVLADLRALTTDSELLLKATADDVSEKAAEVRARLMANVDRAKATIAALQERGVAAARYADETIRENPYKSIGAAFGVGVLLGLFLSRD